MHPTNLKSPIDGETMEMITLGEGLKAFRCKSSGGLYIPAGCYMDWLQSQPARTPHLPGSDAGAEPAGETSDALLCPESGTLMTRYKVGHGFPFSIDRSITGGIWLDGGEWEALRERNFHDEIHLVFTAPWQKQVRDQQAQATYEARLETALGTELVERLRALRSELDGHPHRSLALAFLSQSRR